MMELDDEKHITNHSGSGCFHRGVDDRANSKKTYKQDAP